MTFAQEVKLQLLADAKWNINRALNALMSSNAYNLSPAQQSKQNLAYAKLLIADTKARARYFEFISELAEQP